MSRFVNVARGVAWRSIHNTLVNPAILVPSIIFPLFFLIAFAGGLSRISDVPNFHYAPGYTAFQFVFVFLQSAAFGGVFTGFAVARDFDSGFARRLMLSAPRRSGIIAGYALGALGRWAITGTVVTIAALIAGMNVFGSGVQLIGLLGLGIAMNLVAALWAVGLAMFLRTEQAGAVIQMPVFVLLFLAPVYVPVSLLSGWIHDVANLNPVTPVLEAGRGLLAGSPVKVAIAFIGLIGAALVLAVVSGGWLASSGMCSTPCIARRSRFSSVARSSASRPWRTSFSMSSMWSRARASTSRPASVIWTRWRRRSSGSRRRTRYPPSSRSLRSRTTFLASMHSASTSSCWGAPS
jgi:ABC-2 type transport system permease protein